ncbi:NAD(P)-binding protein [Aspergillus saccharolyticus JOP 1030-1]|uniref:NAD(P)-binding protein n=1 Tax=Aspergillus saccharolyticus JOP 1030-1 TaxID=1450539 RepID=A0A318Z0I1_9EURO|nr:NAD(P)-binding protein [Aspergillus saccharolyticus JOP 1030-1]PYH40419.1 NAD(P)-binding protein [Aspergillus saccharolyticus JOP 1030-1]
MAISANRNIIIVGVGSAMSRSLAMWLASLGWNIALISRTETSLASIAEEVRYAAPAQNTIKIVHRAADAGDPASLTCALDWCLQQLGGTLDVLSYNAARVSNSSITELTPEELELDLRVSAIGTLVAGQWFRAHARVESVADGEWPLYLVTGGVLDKHPDPSVASLSIAKAASQTVSRIFAQVLPEGEARILVGMPLVAGRTVDPVSGEYFEQYRPDKIVQALFRPFFEERERRQNGLEGWTVERQL